MSQDRRYSFEFFPTKTDAGHEKLLATARQLASYNPDFFSCTYGAGGSTRDRTMNTVLQLESEVKIPAAPHLSCVGDSKADLRGLLSQYKAAGINRIVALRGDLPSGMGMASGELRHANDLVSFIREETGDHFHIEVAAYPEMHPQARNFEDDLNNFVRKANAGANSAITQYFFNADSYFYFVERVQQMGVNIRSCPASCRSPTTASWRVSPTPAARKSRAGSASNWKPTATTAKAFRRSANRSSPKCVNVCCKAGRQGCISIP